MRTLTHSCLFALFPCALFAQSSTTAPRFDFADIDTSAKTRNQITRAGLVHDGRDEIRAATMLYLIQTAWNFDAERVLGGPDWLELDKFDITAKTSADSRRLMLQSLLKDRFRLVLHEGTESIPAWVLAAEKKHSLKEADGSGEAGCKQQVEMAGPQGPMIRYVCRNMTMAGFAAALPSAMGVQLRAPVIDQTGLPGWWSFDVKWSAPVRGIGTADQISPADALEKQLGLKLEQVSIPKPVLVVDSVERQPSPDPPGTKEALPDIAIPQEFEVADVKLLDPNAAKLRRRGFHLETGGRFVAEGVPMGLLLRWAFNTTNSDQIVGIPNWADSVQFTITAKVPAEYPAGQIIDRNIIGPMLRALLMERFGLAWHTEPRMVSAYSLVATKPKLKLPTPKSRTFCRSGSASPGMAPNEQVLTCRNATMALFCRAVAGYLCDFRAGRGCYRHRGRLGFHLFFRSERAGGSESGCWPACPSIGGSPYCIHGLRIDREATRAQIETAEENAPGNRHRPIEPKTD
jgi:uncharacterized protein (TIGR03435 family)